MKHPRILYILALCLTIAACSEPPAPQPTLKERLAGKSPEERQEILGLACLDEAERINSRWKHMGHSTVRVDGPHLPETKALCLRMTAAYLSSDAKKHAMLAKQCKEQILPALHSDSSKMVEHAHKMIEVCEEMTGLEISLNEEK